MKKISLEFKFWLVLSRLFFALVKIPFVVLLGSLGLIFISLSWTVGYRSPKLGYSIAAGWLYVLAKALFGLTIRGRENLLRENFVLLASHQSYWDIPILASTIGVGRPLNFIAREGFLFLEHPPVNDFCIFIDRNEFDLKDMRELLRTAEKSLRERPLAVFPEGTTVPEKKEVKGSALSIAERTDKKIVPIVFKSDGPYGKPTGSIFAYLTRWVNLTVEIKDAARLEKLEKQLPRKKEEKKSDYYKRLIKHLLELEA